MKNKNLLSVFYLAAFLSVISFGNVYAAPDAVSLGASTIADVGTAVDAGSDKEMISVNFNRADIQSVLRILALKGNVNIVAGPEVAAEVTIQLKDVPWKSAFETIVSTYGYAYEQDGNIYRVMTIEAFQEMGTEGVRSEVVTLQYADLDEVVTALRSVISGMTIEPIAGTNQLVITSNISNLNMAHDLIESIDKKLPQVHIDTKIVRTALTKSENLGIDWNVAFRASGARRPHTLPFTGDAQERGIDWFLRNQWHGLPEGQTAAESTVTTTSGGASTETSSDFPNAFGFPYTQPEDFALGTLDFSSLQMALNLIKTRANTKVVTNPRIVILNHQEARIQSGREIGIPTFERNESTGSFEITGYEARNDGIEVVVTPHISFNGDILMTVRPELTSFIGFVPLDTNGQSNITSPQFSTTVARTEVMIHSGDTLVIGGLINETESDTRNKVPFFGSIPVFGELFRHRSPSKDRTETIIFITVSLADDVYDEDSITSWKRAQEEYEAFRKYTENDFFKKREEKKKQSDGSDEKSEVEKS